MSFKLSLILGLICLFSSIIGTPLQHEPVPETTTESSPAECNSTSKVTLYSRFYHLGESAYFALTDNQTCVDLRQYNKSNWAYSINTHCTCIIAWLRNDCTGPHIMHTAVDNASHQDLGRNQITDLPEKKTWRWNIGSLSSCNYGNLVSTESPLKQTSETPTEPNPTSCEVIHPNSNSTSQITLFEQVNYCGESSHFEIADNHTCVDLRDKDRADWAKSISTHGTCVLAWYNNDCSGPKIAVDSSSLQDLSSNQIDDLSDQSWALNIASISRCDYKKLTVEPTPETTTEPSPTEYEVITYYENLVSTEFSIESTSETSTEPTICEVMHPDSNSASQITLYEQVNYCGKSTHFEIADNHTCVDLRAGDRVDWAKSISTHGTCVTVWYKYDCTGPHIMHKAVDNSFSPQDLSSNQIADLPEKKTWALNIGSLSSCNYGNLVSTESLLEQTSETPTEPNPTSCEVIHPNSNSTSQITLYEQVNYCGKSTHFEIPDNHTCVDLRDKDRADWVKSISTHGTCVLAWYNDGCIGPNMALTAEDNSSHHYLSSNQTGELTEKTWALNIVSLSSCYYQKFSVQPTPRNSSNYPNLNLQIYFSLFNFNEFFTNSSSKKFF